MLIWSIMPETVIFAGLENIEAGREILYCGRRLVVSELPGGKMCVMRVISSNPRDFMDPRFQPGAIIGPQG